MSEQQSAGGGRPFPPAPARWQDEADVDGGWLPPQDADRVDDRRGLPGPVKAGIVILAIALVITGIWAAGGFKTRTDVRTPAAPGELVTTGPYELTFTDATAQKVKNYNDEILWKVTVRGTGRTTGEESLSPKDEMFEAKDPATVEQVDPSGTSFPSGTSGIGGAANFTPGLEPVPYQVQFEFSKHYEPSDTIQFAVWEVEYAQAILLDTGEKTWRNTIYAYVYELPVEVLPEDLD